MIPFFGGRLEKPCFLCYNERKRTILHAQGVEKWLWGAGILSFLLTTVVVEVPFLCNAFELASLNLTEYAIAMALAISIIPIVEIFKILHRMIDRKKNRH